jgi:hypothetical protein
VIKGKSSALYYLLLPDRSRGRKGHRSWSSVD